MPDFPPLKNDLILRVARGESTKRTPVWMMRQAGRYLPEYQKVRSKHEFFDVVGTPELAAEVTIQPIDRFDLDAAIIFSDILVIPQALGLEVQMVKGKGPHFPEPLRSPSDMSRLTEEPDVDEELGHVYDALTLTRHELDGRVPLIGFSGAPWTLMAYMIEGGGSKNYKRARAWLYEAPDAAHSLLQQTTDVIVDYLIGQVRAGAQMLQVFDSWAGLFGPQTFRTFALPYLKQIAERVKKECPDVPMVVFAKGAHYALEDLVETEYEIIGLDWTMDPKAARLVVGERATLQGNLDPCTLYGDGETIRRAVQDMLAGFGSHRHIANLGHGMHPDHDPEHARIFVDSVHEVSEQMRGV
ncbi:MAG: uroporphyrinogen decarboxylase [Bacteroidetes bacterium]|jgi:uroporphyrinogen decarboxylase|nr:uroporphyrinogen decarboxylase [Bacteroidota bacterium]